jgi:hypothetical protein
MPWTDHPGCFTRHKKRGAQGLAKTFLTAQYGSHYVVYTIWINILLNNIYNKD